MPRVSTPPGEPWRVDFSNDLTLPASVLTERMAFIGVSGSGKTYGAGKLVEGLLAVGGQVVILDNVGNWWGLRLLADGKSPGFSIPLIGGDRGDIALEPEHGKLAAATVAESKASMIIDVSMFTPDELHGSVNAPGFMPTFCTELLALKRRSPAPVLIVWEECHEVLPQVLASKAEGRTLAAAQRLIKKGRNYGVGTLLISQRVAAVSKDVLHQCEWLFAYRTPGKNDRKAVTDWVQHATADGLVSDATLPQLSTGVCVAWTPERFDAKRLRSVKVGAKLTFDSTKTPDLADFAQVAAAVLTPVDLDRFKKKMQAGIAKARENDPEVLRRRIAELEAVAPSLLAPSIAEIEAAARNAYRQGYGDAYGHAFAAFESVIGPIGVALQASRQVLADRLDSVRPAAVRGEVARSASGAAADRPANPLDVAAAFGRERITESTHGLPIPHPSEDPTRRAPRKPTEDAGGAAAQAITRALAQRSPLSRTHVALLAGYSRGSSSFRAGLTEATSLGLVEKQGQHFVATATGRALYPNERAPTPSALLAMWKEKLPARAFELLQIVINYGARGISRSTLAEVANMSAGSSSFRGYITDINRNAMVTKRGGMFVADSFFRTAH